MNKFISVSLPWSLRTIESYHKTKLLDWNVTRNIYDILFSKYFEARSKVIK